MLTVLEYLSQDMLRIFYFLPVCVENRIAKKTPAHLYTFLQ